MKRYWWIGIAVLTVAAAIVLFIYWKRVKSWFNKMKPDFEPIYKFTRLGEGGYQNFPEDTANYNSRGELVGTQYGISAKALEEVIGRPPTVADIKAITEEQAYNIAKSRYWDKINGDRFADQRVAHAVFQEFWGSGYAGLNRVRRVLQLGGTGLIRLTDLEKINRLNPWETYKKLRDSAINARFQIVANGPSKAKFLTGWMNRWKRMDALYNTNPEFSKYWDEIDRRLVAQGLNRTRTDIKP